MEKERRNFKVVKDALQSQIKSLSQASKDLGTSSRDADVICLQDENQSLNKKIL